MTGMGQRMTVPILGLSPRPPYLLMYSEECETCGSMAGIFLYFDAVEFSYIRECDDCEQGDITLDGRWDDEDEMITGEIGHNKEAVIKAAQKQYADRRVNACR